MTSFFMENSFSSHYLPDSSNSLFNYQSGINNTFQLKQSIIDNIDGIQSGMKSYSDYLSYYNNGKRQGKTRLYDKLLSLSEYLKEEFQGSISPDPIHYLIQLYYIDGLSIEKIFSRLNDKCLEYSEDSGIEKMFTKTFGWKLRDTTGSEMTSRIKSNNGQIDKAKGISSKKNKEKVTLIQDYFSNIVSHLMTYEDNDFIGVNDMKKQDKILFMLSKIFGLDNNTIIHDLNILKNDKKVGSTTLSKVINDIFLKHYLPVQAIIVYPKDIINILQK